MLFNSFQFAVFLPIVFILYWAVPNRFRWGLLLVASYYFYMSWNVKYVFLILLTTVVSYAAALALERTKEAGRRKLILVLALAVCLGILIIFKYLQFLFDVLDKVLGVFAIPVHPITLQLLLPVGISFYTFQTLSYVIDVYRGQCRPERHFGYYATFISFFPQLVAGPIERTEHLLPQIKGEHRFQYEQAMYGLRLMVWGFFKKMVVADSLAAYVDLVYDDVTQYRGFALVLASFFFTIQIYGDFSGYSDIARGTAKLLNIELMENFRSPYFSASVREFWSRWHISLSTWFRDYVYIPLGGNRVGKWRHRWNLLITFLVSGLWHGANWTFVAWGGMHGVAQVLENVVAGKLEQKDEKGVWRFVKVGVVFCFVAFAWIFFRSQSLGEAGFVIKHLSDGISSPIAYLHNGFSDLGIGKRKLFEQIVFFITPLFLFDLFSRKMDLIEIFSGRKPVIRWVVSFVFVLLCIFLMPISNGSEFIYFQF